MVDQTIVRVVQSYLAEVGRSGIPVSCGVLFGSFARGEQRPESDIDVLVVSSRFDVRKTNRDVGTLWRLTLKADKRIEPFAVGVHEYAADKWKPLLQAARQEGVVVYPEVQAVPRVAAEPVAEYRVTRATKRRKPCREGGGR